MRHIWRRREMVEMLQEREHLGDRDEDEEDHSKMEFKSDGRM